MTVVLDTNVLLPAIPPKSSTHHIISNLILNKFQLVVTTDILLEYEEVIARKMGGLVADNFMKALIKLPSVKRIDKYFFWNLIEKDPDDNKFVDCAVAANADYLVSEDSDFNVLKNVPFPKVNLIRQQIFLQMLTLP